MYLVRICLWFGELLLRSVSMYIDVVLICFIVQSCLTENTFDLSVKLFLSTQSYLFYGDKSL